MGKHAASTDTKTLDRIRQRGPGWVFTPSDFSDLGSRVAVALADPGLFERVVEHRQIFFRYSWMDYSTMRRGSIRLLPLAEQVDAWRQDYDAMRTEMFFGPAPKFEVVLKTVGEFTQKFNATRTQNEP